MISLKKLRQLGMLSPATLLEEANPARLVATTMLILLLVFALLLLWAANAKVSQFSVSYGELVPEGGESVVQYAKPGVVKKLFVFDGMRVGEGQKIVELEATEVMTNIRTLAIKEASLLLAVVRLEALSRQQDPAPEVWRAKLKNSAVSNLIDEQEINLMINREEKAYQFEKINLQNQREVFVSKLILKKQELKQLQESKMSIHKNERNTMTTKIIDTNTEIAAAARELKQFDLNATTARDKELVETTENLHAVQQQLKTLTTELKKLIITSPVAGVVKDLKIKNGEVITAGEILMKVLPFNSPLVVEARIEPRDIGHVNIGDAVKVKISTYESSHYGSLAGTLENISGSTYLSAQGTPYYKGMIRLSQQVLSYRGQTLPLLPGMTVEANILTGQRTVIAYLLRPLNNSLSNAFSER